MTEDERKKPALKIVMVEPITKKPTNYELPSYINPIFEGHHQNASMVAINRNDGGVKHQCPNCLGEFEENNGGLVSSHQCGKPQIKNAFEILARCADCKEQLEVIEVEGSSLNKIMVTVKASHDCVK